MKTMILGLAAAASLLVVPAAAQPAASQDGARKALRTFAACLFEANSRVANDILLQPLASVPQQEVIDRRVAGVRECTSAGTGVSYNALTLAGALSEAALERRSNSDDVAQIADLTQNAIALANLDPRNGYEELGLCVARRAPGAVRAWALSEPGSAAEAAARRIVVPQVRPCVNQGEPLRADYVGLRAILSAALYRALRLTRL
jgi:hypothetical protein